MVSYIYDEINCRLVFGMRFVGNFVFVSDGIIDGGVCNVFIVLWIFCIVFLS